MSLLEGGHYWPGDQRQESDMPLSDPSLYFQLNAAQYLWPIRHHRTEHIICIPSPAQPSPARCVADLYQLSPVKSATLPGAGTRLHAGTTRVDTVCSVSAVVYKARYPQPEQKVVRFNLASNHHGLGMPTAG